MEQVCVRVCVCVCVRACARVVCVCVPAIEMHIHIVSYFAIQTDPGT
jgi:hypothetical protein